MAGIAVLLVVLLISVVVTRVATVALTMTGVSRDLARFQARSAFSGVGYTTSEAEQMTGHPARRRIVMTLMLVGNAGLATAVASIVVAVVRTDDSTSALFRIGVLLGGLLGLYLLTRSKRVEQLLRRGIHRVLERWTELELHDYESLLDLTGEYTVVEIDVEADSWLAERSLDELDLPEEGVSVLGVLRSSHRFLGAPGGDTVLEAGDRVVVYGHTQALQSLSGRVGGQTGQREHERSVEQHRGDLARNAESDEGKRRDQDERSQES